MARLTSNENHVKKRRLKDWWRKDAAVTHREHGDGAITNFVGCPKGCANVYFYAVDCVRKDIPRSALRRTNLRCSRCGNQHAAKDCTLIS